MNTRVSFLMALCVVALSANLAAAQSCCPTATVVCPGQEYRIVYKTVCEQQQYTAYRIELETVCEQRQVTCYRPMWETRYRDRHYTVSKPVYHTATHEQRYTVSKPVWVTQYRQECRTVCKPVYEQGCRTEYQTVLRPVTTYRTQCVDQGCYREQTVFKPCPPKIGLSWQPAGCTVDPCTGQTTVMKPGLYWTQQPRGRYEVQRVWQPNLVTQQIPCTTYRREVVAKQVPVRICRMRQETVTRQVPVQVCRMETEVRVRQVPVTTCRIVCENRVEKVPYRVCRMEPYQKTIQVQRCVEKRVPITYTCTVPRVVCCREAIDPCGNPIVTSCGEPPVGTPPQSEEPTPASKDASGSGEKPGLPRDKAYDSDLFNDDHTKPPLKPEPDQGSST